MSGFHSMLLGAAGWVVRIVTSSSSYSDTTGSGASCAITFELDGRITVTTTAGTFTVGSWIAPLAFANAVTHELRATLNSGALSFGTVNSDLLLTSDRTFQVFAAPGNSQTATLTFAVKENGDTRDSKQITITANPVGP